MLAMQSNTDPPSYYEDDPAYTVKEHLVTVWMGTIYTIIAFLQCR